METKKPSLTEVINEAKAAIKAGDTESARKLAELAYQMDPKSVDALLLKAGTTDLQGAIPYLNTALAIDPANPFAREAMTYTAAELRSSASAAWKPEETSEIRVVAGPLPQPRRRERMTLPLVVALCAVAIVGLVQFGAFSVDSGNRLFGLIPLPGKGQANVKPADAMALSQPGGKAAAEGALVNEKAEQTQTGAKVYLPLASAGGSSSAASSQTGPGSKLSQPASTPIPGVYGNQTIPVIQITPVSSADAPGITSVIVTAESGEGSLEPPAEEEIDLFKEVPVIPIVEVPAEIAAQYAFVEAQPVVSYGEKWIDIDLSNQMLYAYEGDTLVNSFLVSTGLPSTPTVTGTFNIYVKYRYASMRGDDYDLPNVPYTMYFYDGYGIHGTYWHHNFGTPMSHGCVNMETSQAGWVFNWAPVGTIVNVHY